MKRSAVTRRYKTREQCEVEQATTVTANEKELNFYHETPGLGKVTVLQVAILAWTRRACVDFFSMLKAGAHGTRGCVEHRGGAAAEAPTPAWQLCSRRQTPR